MRPEGEKDTVSDEDGARKTALNVLAVDTSEKQDKEAGGKNEMPDNSKHTVPFHKLFSFADSTDVILMILGSLGAVGNGISLPLMTVLYGNLIQSFGGSSDDILDEVSRISLKFVYLAIGSGVASFLQVACWMATGERQSARIRNLYLKTILRQEIAFFDKETNTGKVVERMSGDTVLIRDAMGEKVGTCIKLISTFIGALVIAFIQGWLLTLVMLCTLPPMVLAGGIMATVLSRMASIGQEAYGEAANVVEQTIGSIRTVASFTGEKRAVEKYDKSLVQAYKTSVQEGLVSGFGIGSIFLFMFMGYSLGIWYGAKLILHNGYTGGKVMNVILAIIIGSSLLGQTAPSMQAFAAGQAAAYKMFETIDRKPEIDAYDAKGKILDDIQGEIEFKDVHFSYPARPDEQIFRGFSLCIQKGTTVALVGESGSGKSTVISLIERFYDPQAGEVLIDGINLKEFQLRWIREKIGLVSQEPVLFATSIRDNIAYGKGNATAEEIRAATELANAAKFIDKLPQGLDTMVGEHGTQLSGGQKQRVAIARAILKHPRILLLDEATSALDAESERIVQQALDRVMEDRTTVIVAHRLSTVRNAETIAVIHQGSIVEKGSHSELLKNPDGAYTQLIRLQEVNRVADNINKPDPEKSDACTDLDQTPSRNLSFDHSISQRSSRMHGNWRNSFQAPLGVPGGVDAGDSTLENADPEAATEERQGVPLRRLANLNKPELPVLILGSFAAIATGFVFPMFGILLSNVIKAFYEPPPKLRKDSNFWSLIFLIFGLVSLVIFPVRIYLFGVAGSKLIQRIRLMTFQNVVNMEVGWFDNTGNSSGEIGARLSADSAIIKSLVGDALALVIQNITTLVAGLVIAFVANWQLSFIILALVPLLCLNGYVQVKSIKGFSKDAKKMYEEASQVANAAVGSIRTVASFSAEEKVMEIYRQKCEGPARKGTKQALISGAGFGVSFFSLFCVYAVSFYAGARLVESGKTSFDKVFRIIHQLNITLVRELALLTHEPNMIQRAKVFFALSMAATGISQSSSMAPDSAKAKAATASVFAILDRKSKIDPGDDSGMTIEGLAGNIEIKHVSFRYPTRPDIQIFQDLCLTIQSGKTVALVGESGSGKSTVVSLLQRFYNPDSGEIFLDGIEIRKLQLRWLRQQMGLVSQEPALFNDTIRANIAYGKDGNATEAEIVAAAEISNAHRFLCSLQKGYDTIVGEKGVQLSGGQKQRIAIARAIVKDPRIVLLDEATSALDAESERVVQDALDRVMVNRTTVVVAHRLSTVKAADVIAVVKNGGIAEKGNHETLMKVKDGAYASLVALHMTAAS